MKPQEERAEEVAQFFWEMGSQGNIIVDFTISDQETYQIGPFKFLKQEPFEKIFNTDYGTMIVRANYKVTNNDETSNL